MPHVFAVLLVLLAPAPLGAQEKPKLGEARERLNKMWDERIVRMQRAHIESQCKAQARKAYWAIRFNKRRAFVEECVSKASAPAAAPAAHQVY